MRRDVVVLGCTGSVGTQALEVVERAPDRFRVVALAAGGARPELLAEQARRHRVEAVAVADPAAGERVRGLLAGTGPAAPAVRCGPDAVAELAGRPCDVVLNALTGAGGLAATLAALDAGRTLALANKESLVVGGPLVRERARPEQIVPVDSEHSALAQCLRGGRAAEVRRLLLTASGGPFRGRRADELAHVSPEQALAHPTWNMGPVITVNSATLVNKGLELIEAHLLFDVPYERIDVVVHPQSVVHSLVEFVDGSTLAQLSPPDMRLPIALALGWPDRVPEAAPAVDWSDVHEWRFEPLDPQAFPAVALARAVGARGATYPAVFNAANEEAVEAFLAGRLPFTGIVATVERVVTEHVAPSGRLGLGDVLGADRWARSRARAMVRAA